MYGKKTEYRSAMADGRLEEKSPVNIDMHMYFWLEVTFVNDKFKVD